MGNKMLTAFVRMNYENKIVLFVSESLFFNQTENQCS